jgi:hypothetical protein
MANQRKSPQEKKRLSLQKDRRNSYGENDKSSRKNIRRSKAISRRLVRHKSAEVERVWSRLDEASGDSVELTLTSPRRQKPKFRKEPDLPLREAVKWKLARRKQTGPIL